MNEIRMYVEYLFQGKVLTPETIELKEEIYGNLVARYEDYVAGGMDEAEALEKTKASMTSVDDVFSGEDTEASAAARASLASDGVAAAGAGVAATESPGLTERMPIVKDAAANQDAGAAAKGVEAVETAPKRKMQTIVLAVVGCVAAVFLLGVLAFGLNSVDDQLDAAEDRIENTQVSDPDDDDVSPADNVNPDTPATDTPATDAGATDANATDGNTSSVTDISEYDANQVTREIDQALMSNDPSVLANYAGLNVSDAGQVANMLDVLPLGADYAQNISWSKSAGGTLSFDLLNVPDAIDGDSIDRVLVYDVVALMAASPDIQVVQVRVQESDDSIYDADRYVFERTNLEGNTRNMPGLGTKLTSALFDDATAWDDLRMKIATERYDEDDALYEVICDIAERD